MRPLRVVQLVGTFELGGGERVALTLAREIGPPEFVSELWCTGGDGPLTGFARREGAAWRALGSEAKQCGVLKLARALREQRADIVHCHGKRAHFQGAPAAALAGARACVLTRHGLGDLDVSPRVRLIEEAIAPLTHRYVAVCEHVRRHTARYRRIVFAKSIVIPNGVDTGRFHPPPEPRPPDGVVRIGCVARLSEEKRHRDLLHAAALLHRDRVPLEILLVGDGPLRAALERTTRELGLTGCVTFLGARNDVPELLRSFDAFVLPSRSEGLPLTVLEAMATGLPVVATDVGGVSEAVRDGETGLLVPPGEIRALADALRRVASDAAFRRRAGGSARALAVSRYGLPEMIAAHRALYRRLGGAGRAP